MARPGNENVLWTSVEDERSSLTVEIGMTKMHSLEIDRVSESAIYLARLCAGL